MDYPEKKPKEKFLDNTTFKKKSRSVDCLRSDLHQRSNSKKEDRGVILKSNARY